jgi:hypothetical protein
MASLGPKGPDTVTVSTAVSVTVNTAEFRRALTAVYPHRSKVKTGDASAEYRVRLIFAAGWLFVAASNGASTALARVKTYEDSRDPLEVGKLDKDDAPIRVDLQPRHALEVNRMFASKAKAADIDHELRIFVSTTGSGDEGTDDPYVRFTDVGGMLSDGESYELPYVEPHESFPDVVGITGEVLANAGASTQGKDLTINGEIAALFQKAGKAYDAPVAFRASGTPESRSFLVEVGADFRGTVSSRHSDDDSLGKRNKAHQSWLEQIAPRKLKSA